MPDDTPDKQTVTVDFLDAYARKQWEAILYYVVGSAKANLGGNTDISAGTRKLLSDGMYVKVMNHRASITEAGFSFLLQEIKLSPFARLNRAVELRAAIQHIDVQGHSL